MAVCALLAVIIERVAYKPLRKAPRISALITAIGVSFFLEYFGALPFVFTPNYITYERPFPSVTWYVNDGIHRLEQGGTVPPNSITFSNIFIIIVITSLLLLVALQFIVQPTKIGKAMRAVAYDKPTARLMGINVDRDHRVTFAIGAALAGAAGMLYAIAYPAVSVFHGHHARPQGLCGGRAGRHRQHSGRLCGRPDHGPGRSHERRLHLDAHARRHRLYASSSSCCLFGRPVSSASPSVRKRIGGQSIWMNR